MARSSRITGKGNRTITSATWRMPVDPAGGTAARGVDLGCAVGLGVGAAVESAALAGCGAVPSGGGEPASAPRYTAAEPVGGSTPTSTVGGLDWPTATAVTLRWPSGRASATAVKVAPESV